MWVILEEFPNYEINQFGVVRNASTHYVLKQRMNPSGYLYVELLKDDKCNTCLVHRLVATTFIPNPDHLPIVNHIDECYVHNSVDNLEWVSYKENSNHGTRNKRIIRNRRDPVVAYDKDGNVIQSYESKHAAARSIGVSEAAVRKSIKKGYQCKGLYFKLYNISDS
ncbi:MAG: HNH endonuclease [Oscillospiraceae bacterium]|nr:HNH endonuclease [Oscillospiraceae bacterium]